MRKVLWIAIGLVAAALLLLYLASWLIAVTSPRSLEYEAPCLWAAVELARGHNAFPPQSLVAAPWVIIMYSPLYFVLGSFFEHGSPSYIPLRVISMVSFVVTMVYLWRLLRLYYKDRLIISTVLLTFAGSLPSWSWSWKARVDMLSVAFSIMAIYYFATAFNKLKSFESPSSQMTILAYLPSSLLSVAAVYTKQPSIVVPAVVFIFLLLKRRFFDIAVYVGLCLVSGGPLLALAQVLTDGGFWAHMVFTARCPFSIYDVMRHFSWIAADWPKLWTLCLLGVLWLIAMRRKKVLSSSDAWCAEPARDDVEFALLLAAASGAIAFYTLGSVYANLNHGLIYMIGCAWLMAIFLPALPRLGCVLLLLSTILSTIIIGSLLPNLQNIKDSMVKTPRIPEKRLSDPAWKNEQIFVEDAQWAWELGVVPLFVDAATFLQVWERDGRPLDDIIGALESRKYPLVIINKHDSEERFPTWYWNADVIRAIKQNYKKTGEVVGNGEMQDVYLPK